MVSCLAVPSPFLADVGAAISTSAEFSTSGMDIVNGRDCMADDVTRTRHDGRRNELTGRRNEIRLDSGNTETYITLWVFFHYLLPLR